MPKAHRIVIADASVLINFLHLDRLDILGPAPSRVHVFYSGPTTLAFSLGRQISPTIHPPVFVYNFSTRTTSKYSIHRLHREVLERLLAGSRENDVVVLFPERRGDLLPVGLAVVDGEDLLGSEEDVTVIDLTIWVQGLRITLASSLLYKPLTPKH